MRRWRHLRLRRGTFFPLGPGTQVPPLPPRIIRQAGPSPRFAARLLPPRRRRADPGFGQGNQGEAWASFTRQAGDSRRRAAARLITSRGRRIEPPWPQAVTPVAAFASIQPLPGNLLSPADSDFETWTGDWTAGTNTTVAQSPASAFTGAYSLSLTAAVSGAITAVSPYLTGAAERGFVASGYLAATAAGRTGHLALTYYNSSHTSIGTTTGTSVALTSGSYTPVTIAGGCPAGTAYVKVTATVNGAAATETAYFDMAYATITSAQFLAAWYTQPSASTPVYADITPFVRADKGVSINRGRADEVSEVQAGRVTFTVDNTTGWFSPGNTACPWYPGVLIGRRVQVNRVDETGAWHTRAGVYLTDLPVSWDGGPAKQSLVACAASGLLAKIGRLDELRTMLEQEILYDSPSCFYTLADGSGSTQASDSSGNAAAPLILRTYGSGGALSFGDGTAIVEAGDLAGTSPVTSILCTPSNTGASAADQNNVQLEGFLPSPVTASAGFTAEIWSSGVTYAFNTEGATWYAISIGNPRTGQMIGVRIAGGSAGTVPTLELVYTANMYASAPSFTTVSLSNSLNGFPYFQPGMFAVTVSGTTASLYYNSLEVMTLIGSITVPASFEGTYLTVAGPLGGNQGWQGSLNCAAVWPAVLTSARLSAHWGAGWDAYQGSYIYQLMADVVRYAGIPSSAAALPAAGASYADLYTLDGETPLQALQTYEQTDGGVLYENAAGQLAYQDRTARYAAQATAASVLTLPAGLYEPDFTPVVTDQFLINDSTVATPAIPAGARAVNTTSLDNYGTYPAGTPQSPTSGPYYSLGNTGAGAVHSPDVIGDAASWNTGAYGQPAPRSPTVTVDLLTGPGDGLSRAAVYAAEMGTLLELTGLPSQMPGGIRPNFMLIEGMTETFQITEDGAADTITFNTSPSMQSAAWIPGDPAMGILDSTAVVGRGADGSGSGGLIGPPYAVPVFSNTMNLTGNVGANDMRGLAWNIQQAVTPPCALALQIANSQSVPNSTNTDMIWDTLEYDTASGWTLQTGNAWYTVRVAGVYLLMACVLFQAGGAGDRTAFFQQNGTQVDGQETIPNSGSVYSGAFTTATITAAVGDELKVSCWQSSGSALSTGLSGGGSTFSILFLGT